MRKLLFNYILFALLLLLATGASAQTFVDISSGVSIGGSAIAGSGTGGMLHTTQYRIVVPAGATQLSISLSFDGGSDLDLYVNRDAAVAAPETFLWSSDSLLQPEELVIDLSSSPPLSAGTCYIAIANWKTFVVPFTLTATVTGGGQPDLALGSFMWTGSSITEGNPFFLQPTISNAGTASAGASHVRLYLSLDDDFDTSNDYLLTPDKAVPSIAVGGSDNSAIWNFSFPNLADTASYSVWPVFVVDNLDEVSESSENNLFKATSPITVTNAAATSPTPTPTSTRTYTPTPTETPTEPARQVSVGTAAGAPGAGVQLSVTIDNAQDVAGMDFDISFNGSLVAASQATLGTLPSAFRIASNPEAGRLRISMAGNSGLTGSGQLLNLPFTIAPGATNGQSTTVTVSSVELYLTSGALNASGGNGQISVSGSQTTPTPTPTPTATRTPGGPFPEDINGDGVVDYLDLLQIFQRWHDRE
jgi:Cohesin domain/CARDB